MSKITYGTKSGTITPALPDSQVWKDEDANEVKTVVNDNDDQLQAISKSGLLTVTVKLDLISGYFVNTAQSPITTTIPVDLTGAIQGGQAAIWYKGAVIGDSTITGVSTIIRQGTNVLNAFNPANCISGLCPSEISNELTIISKISCEKPFSFFTKIGLCDS